MHHTGLRPPQVKGKKEKVKKREASLASIAFIASVASIASPSPSPLPRGERKKGESSVCEKSEKRETSKRRGKGETGRTPAGGRQDVIR